MTDYPQHEKLDKIKDTSQEIGLFLEWLQGQGVSLMRWEHIAVAEYPCGNPRCLEGHWLGEEDRLHVLCKGTGYITVMDDDWVHDPRTIIQLLADFYRIDYPALMAEKDTMLKDIREVNHH